MSPSLNTRTTCLLGLAALMAGCASKPLINPSETPKESVLDDGVDYYSADLDDEAGILSTQSDQWTTDENGDRVYLLNQVRRGAATYYYVGDIRYWIAQENRSGVRTESGYSRSNDFNQYNGYSPHDPSYRGTPANVYQPVRRGRVTYLPVRTLRPAQTNQGTGSTTSSSTSSSNPRPTTTSPRPVRRTAPPPTSRPQRQTTKPRDESLQPDR